MVVPVLEELGKSIKTANGAMVESFIREPPACVSDTDTEYGY